MNLLRQLEKILQGEADQETTLVMAAQRGSREAFDSLLRSHEPLLRGYLSRRVGLNAVDDVLQETWLASWLALPHYSRRARFKAWLFGIAFHKSADYHRTRSRASIERPLYEAEEIVAQPDWVANTELQQTVQAQLAQLPAEQREVLEMYYYAELTLAEIARELHRSVNTVKSQFYRAHTQIARRFDTLETENRELFMSAGHRDRR